MRPLDKFPSPDSVAEVKAAPQREIELHIDELVLYGFPPGQRQQIGEAIRGVAAKTADRTRVTGAIPRYGERSPDCRLAHRPHRQTVRRLGARGVTFGVTKYGSEDRPVGLSRLAWDNRVKAMNSFPGSPRILKGAIIGLDPLDQVSSVVVFQYNPELLSRTIRPQYTGGDQGQAEPARLNGPPEETLQIDVTIDATDQLEQGDPVALSLGLGPTLSALEILLYPSVARVLLNDSLAKQGMIEVLPPVAPLTLLVWGRQRVLPVRLREYTITEEAFDSFLNPIRAKVGLSMKVLTYQELGLSSHGGALSLASHVLKETMAAIQGAQAPKGDALRSLIGVGGEKF